MNIDSGNVALLTFSKASANFNKRPFSDTGDLRNIIIIDETNQDCAKLTQLRRGAITATAAAGFGCYSVLECSALVSDRGGCGMTHPRLFET